MMIILLQSWLKNDKNNNSNWDNYQIAVEMIHSNQIQIAVEMSH